MKEYSDEDIKKLDEEYYALKEKNLNLSFANFAKKINSLDHEDKIYFQRKMLNDYLDYYCKGYFEYGKKSCQIDKEACQIISGTVKTFSQESTFWFCVYYYFNDDKKNLEICLDKFFLEVKDFYEQNSIDEGVFVEDFLDIYKNAYPGFWSRMSERFKKCKCIEASNLCNLFEDFYHKCKTDEEKETVLLDYIRENPNTVLAKEFLGFIYGNMKLWYNAISIFEQVSGKSCFYYFEDICFQLAWCYGKVREYSPEEENYRKCLKENPHYPNALNNLGYCLYRQRNLDEAEKIFLQCIEENRDLPYSVNNLVRTYLQTGQIEKAKKFIETKNYKISKDLINRTKNYSEKNISGCEEPYSEDEGIAENKKFVVNDEVKREQFSSEKILEDEIVARLESGKKIFGLNLKVYRRKGDYYGRQYPYNDGKNNYRLDILCEDERENLYIIELKKDSGYDDAYKQIKNYVDYFEKNRAKGKEVFGILCLNSPTEKLLQDVRQDKRIRLFEYKISYNEIL